MLFNRITMGSEEVQLIIIVSTLVILMMAAGFVSFFIYIQKRKNRFIWEKDRIREELEMNYLTSQMEIQENMLQYIGMELHDNLGQILSTVKIKLAMVMNEGEDTGTISEVHDLISTSIREIRSLSRTLNKDHIQNFGLVEATEIELRRYRRWKIIQTHFDYHADEVLEYDKNHLILFRILQEFFSNTIRHAQAKNIWVEMHNGKEILYIKVRDDGIGIDNVEMQKKGSGLLNMHNRAQMINADIELLSSPGTGTEMQLSYPHKVLKTDMS